jgi:hypothetical protein
MFGMLFLIFGIDEDIVDEDHYEVVELRHKHGFMRYMKYTGAFVRPKDITKNL